GEPLPVEDLLARHPGLREDPGALLDLVFNEVLCREGQGESLAPEEYQARFPHLAAEIAEHFAVHRALGTGSLADEKDSPSRSSTQPRARAGKGAGAEVARLRLQLAADAGAAPGPREATGPAGRSGFGSPGTDPPEAAGAPSLGPGEPS